MAKKRYKMTADLWQLAGLFLIAEGALSIIGSRDQQGISQIGRIVRIGIGYVILTQK